MHFKIEDSLKMESAASTNILYSCLYKSKFEKEQIVAETVLVQIQSGQIQFTTSDGSMIYKAGDVVLLKRNLLVKTRKLPDSDGKPFRSLSIFLDPSVLRNYATQNGILSQATFEGKPMFVVPPNAFINGFFESLLPYAEQPDALTQSLSMLKTQEAIELLLRLGILYKKFLFDFSEPHKIDLENFMVQNFQFNVSLRKFAQLTGRSISTFKRDFFKIFLQTPEKWLKDKRLEQAHYMIAEKKQKPSDVYLQVGFENFSHFSDSFKERFGYNASVVSG